MTAIIIDTETTGIEDPDPVQIAWSSVLHTPRAELLGIESSYFKPRKPISLGAMSTHHIIDKDVENATPWLGGWAPTLPVKYLIGHNIDFDWKVIGSPNIKRICTLALARCAWPNIDSHTLTACIYNIYPHALARGLVKHAHNAEADVDLCYRVLCRILEVVHAETWDELYNASEMARIPTHFTFGKYGPRDGKKGAAIAEVRKTDRGYISWCLRDCDIVTKDEYWIKALTQ